MNTEAEILLRVRNIESTLGVIRGFTSPRMNQFAAAIVGLLACSVTTFVLESNQVPYASAIYEDVNDYVANHAATVGLWLGDIIGNVDRSLPGEFTGQIIGLTSQQTCRLAYVMRQRESRGNYSHPGNWAGYMGAYQIGASALAAIGLMKPSDNPMVKKGLPPAHQIYLNNPSNWLIAGGKATFLASKSGQDNAFLALANLNVKQGFSSKALIASQPSRIAGYVAAAHLKGSSRADSWYLRGKDSHDGNGTNTSNYAAMGESAIDKDIAECRIITEENPDDNLSYPKSRFF